MSSKVQISSEDEKTHFEAVFNTINDDLLKELNIFNLPENGKVWIEKLINHTIKGGKMNRGLAVVSSLRALVAPRKLTENELFKAELVGWCIEILQAFFLVADDIMDSSLTRRGLPCWYKLEGVGLTAINDSFILEQFIYRLLRKYLKSDPAYIELLDLFHETTYQTTLGQLMDLITAPEDDVDLNRFSIKK
ncbi:Farnesyl pyrophosphate synthetase [Nowakowskiella sp. JEL0078]|nr:Farnesyl pyrophosphate synthetase [Nowakowskiella sp. JEL0078]